jgi:hypothetical protein
VVFGAGRHPSIALVPISVAFTLVSLVVSEYLIARHFLGIAAAEISAEFGVSIAEVEADPEDDDRVLGLLSVGLGHRLLELDGSAKRINGAGELD